MQEVESNHPAYCISAASGVAWTFPERTRMADEACRECAAGATGCQRAARAYLPGMFAMVLICVAVLCLAVSPAPSPQGWLAIVLTVVALLAVCLRWQPFG